MDRKRKVGVKGEKIALDYLLDKGMHIEALNWRAGHKEIDIIAKENEMVVFIEVKTRRSVRHGQPEEAITPVKIKSVTEAALHYLQDKIYRDIRFDVIAITLLPDDSHELLHIRDAFY